MNEKIENNIINKIKSKKLLSTILVATISLLLVLVFTISFSQSEKEIEKSTAETYIFTLENKLTDVLSRIDGAGNVSVIIKAESGMETVLAKETKTKEYNGTIEIIETPVLVNGKTVVLKELYPKITGVLIVTEGKKNISLTNKILEATTSLLGVNINCIEILTVN